MRQSTRILETFNDTTFERATRHIVNSASRLLAQVPANVREIKASFESPIRGGSSWEAILNFTFSGAPEFELETFPKLPSPLLSTYLLSPRISHDCKVAKLCSRSCPCGQKGLQTSEVFVVLALWPLAQSLTVPPQTRDASEIVFNT